MTLKADNHDMHGPAASALSVLLFGLTALLVLAAAGKWLKLAQDRERLDERPAIPVHAFRSAAAITSAALAMVALSLLWSAFVALP
jgi:uncharacterized membrane protein YidH (DUF202 family)